MLTYNTAEEFAADESFQDYCLGKSPVNSRKWEKFEAKNPAKRALLEEARMLVHLFSIGDHKMIKASPKKRHFIHLNLFKVCAVLIPLIVTLALFSIQNNQEEFQTITKVANGQHQSILLSDLTNVDLRKNSTLSFKESWENDKVRSVDLKGEAYFNVQKSISDGKAFEVNLENGSILVFGTKFLVKSTPSYAMIILEEGRINYRVDSQNYELFPGDVLRYNKEMVSIHHKKDVGNYDSWRKQVLTFKNAPIEEIISTINNSYDLKVSIGSERLRNKKITTTIQQNDPIQLLQAIAAIYEMDIDINESQIVLK